MTLLRLLNPQGIAGIVVSVALALLLVIQKGETSHWKKQSGQFEQLYNQEQTALAGTVANYRAAAAQAQAADQANTERVAAAQRSINERTDNEFEARLAAARAVAERLRSQAASASADPRTGSAAPVSELSAAANGPPQAAGQNGFPVADQELATEQAIQLDELIKWVKAQTAVDPNSQ